MAPSFGGPSGSAPATSSPSVASTFPLRQAELKLAVMVLEVVPAFLPADSLEIWKNATESAITNEAIRVLGSDQVGSVDVQVEVRSQNTQAVPKARQAGTPGILTIEYDVNFAVHTIVDELDTRRYVGAAFDSAEDQQVFIDELKSSGDPNFAALTSIRSELDSSTAIVVIPAASMEEQEIPRDPENKDDGDDDEGIHIGVVVGAVVGAISGITLAALLFYARDKRQRGQGSTTRLDAVAGLDFFSVESMSHAATPMDPTRRPEIELRVDEEVSTLGDPLPENTPAADTSLDDTTANPSLPYDYKVACRELYSLQEGDSQANYSDVSSNIEEGDDVGDLSTLDDTLDYQYNPSPLRSPEQVTGAKTSEELSFSAVSSNAT
eukprot:Sro1460_g274670.1 Hemolysin-type calcium-binding repeat (2 copies) (380) ;mRNA; r:22974-24113